MRQNSISSLLIILVILLVFALTNYTCCSAESEGLWDLINEAKAELEGAFKAVLSAESAGANVSDLISRLNLAGGLLAEAYMALRIGEISDVALKLEECINVARGIKGEASSLREAALAETERLFWRNIMLSAAGVTIFPVLLLIVWRRFRRFYVKRLMNMKPEVSMDAEP